MDKSLELFKRNVGYIKSMLPSLYHTVVSEFPLFRVGLHEVDGSDNLIIETGDKTCFVHSIYDRSRELERMLEGMEQGCRTLIIFGTGCGDIFDYINRLEAKLDHVIVIEPSLQVFRTFLSLKSIEKLVQNLPNLTFIVNKTYAEAVYYAFELIYQNINTRIHICANVTYRTIFKDYFNEFSKGVFKKLRANITSVATTFSITYLRINNVMNNIRHNACEVSELWELLKELPVIMVSAGTSLNNNMKYLEEAKGKAVVIAVGTAIQILEKNGIRPHLRAALSPHVDTTIFKDMQDREIPLIFTNTLYYDIIPEYTGPKFRVHTYGDVIGAHLLKKCDIPFSTVVAELSIANMIFEMLCAIGCKKIILVGQDMSFLNNQMYADGSVENIVLPQSANEQMMKVQDVYGETAYTNSKFLGMKDALLRSMDRNPKPDREVINCSEGGIAIERTVFRPLKVQLDGMERMDGFEAKLEAVIADAQNAQTEYSEKLDRTMDEILQDILKIKEINEERVQRMTELINLRENGEKARKILNKYKDINSFEERMKQVPFYNEVVMHELNSMNNIIVSAYKYNGNDLDRQLEAVESILVRACLEIRKFCNAMKLHIDEYKGVEPEEFLYEKYSDISDTVSEEEKPEGFIQSAAQNKGLEVEKRETANE